MGSLHLAQQIFMGMNYQEGVPDFSMFQQMLLGPHTMMPVEHHPHPHEEVEQPSDAESEAHYRHLDDKIA